MSTLSDFEWDVLRRLNAGQMETSSADQILKALDALAVLQRNQFVTRTDTPNVTSFFITEAGREALAQREGTRH